MPLSVSRVLDFLPFPWLIFHSGVHFSLGCLCCVFSKVCLAHAHGSSGSLPSVPSQMSLPRSSTVADGLCSPRSACSLTAQPSVSLSHVLAAAAAFLFCLPLFFFSPRTLFITLCFWPPFLAFSFLHVLSASLGPLSVFCPALCASVSLCSLWCSISLFLSAFSRLFSALSLCSPLGCSASAWACVFSSRFPALLSPCIFFVPVCMFVCVTKGLPKPFSTGAEHQLSKWASQSCPLYQAVLWDDPRLTEGPRVLTKVKPKT